MTGRGVVSDQPSAVGCRLWLGVWVIGVLLVGVACTEEVSPTAEPDLTTRIDIDPAATDTPLPDEATAAPDDPAVEATETVTVTAPTGEPTEQREITILYTNDEHGWMEGTSDGSSAAHLLGLWRELEGFDPDGSFLLLSGGDLWTGPAISTWFNGASMVEVMNAMGYHAAAVGNHEFDFGLEVLAEHAATSSFPLLSANIRYRADGTVPTDLGIEPYVIREVNGITVGIIGLSTTNTPTTTKPANVADFEFIGYEEALREFVPEVKAAGAELILVPGHVCRFELSVLAQRIADLGVHMLGGGHCNELFVDQISDVALLAGGSSLASYATVRFSVELATGAVTIVDAGTNFNVGGEADPVVADVIERWQIEAEGELNRVIGFTENGVARRSIEMQDLIVESWLDAYPAGDVALTNFGGMRADIPPGDITVGTIVGVMPFDNVIIEVLLTGSELEAIMQGRRDNTAVGGMFWSGGQWILDETGEPLAPDALYSVLVNDFMYTGGDGFDFQAYDPDGYDTSINWRQPVIDWIEREESSAVAPLDSAIQELGR